MRARKKTIHLPGLMLGQENAPISHPQNLWGFSSLTVPYFHFIGWFLNLACKVTILMAKIQFFGWLIDFNTSWFPVLDLDRIFQLLNPPGFYTSWLPPRQGKPWQKDLSQQQQEMSQQIQAHRAGRASKLWQFESREMNGTWINVNHFISMQDCLAAGRSFEWTWC